MTISEGRALSESEKEWLYLSSENTTSNANQTSKVGAHDLGWLGTSLSDMMTVREEKKRTVDQGIENVGWLNTSLSNLVAMKTEKSMTSDQEIESKAWLNTSLSDLIAVGKDNSTTVAPGIEKKGWVNTSLSDMMSVRGEKKRTVDQVIQDQGWFNASLSDMMTEREERSTTIAPGIEDEGWLNTNLSDLITVKKERSTTVDPGIEDEGWLNTSLADLITVKKERSTTVDPGIENEGWLNTSLSDIITVRKERSTTVDPGIENGWINTSLSDIITVGKEKNTTLNSGVENEGWLNTSVTDLMAVREERRLIADPNINSGIGNLTRDAGGLTGGLGNLAGDLGGLTGDVDVLADEVKGLMSAEEEDWVRVLQEVSYGMVVPCVVAAGLVINALGLYLLTRPAMRTRAANKYLVVLVACDILTLVACVPTIITLNGCNLVSYNAALYLAHTSFTIFYILQTFSLYIILWISFDRFLALWAWDHFHRTQRRAVMVLRLTLTLLLCIGIHMRHLVDVEVVCWYGDGHTTLGYEGSGCEGGMWVLRDGLHREGREATVQETMWWVVRGIVVLAVPVLLVLVFNGGIVVGILMRRLHNAAATATTRRHALSSIYITLVVSATFLLCTLPVVIHAAFFASNIQHCHGPYPEEVFRALANILLLLEHLTHVPVLALNQTFRAEASKLFASLKSLGRSTAQTLLKFPGVKKLPPCPGSCRSRGTQEEAKDASQPTPAPLFIVSPPEHSPEGVAKSDFEKSLTHLPLHLIASRDLGAGQKGKTDHDASGVNAGNYVMRTMSKEGSTFGERSDKGKVKEDKYKKRFPECGGLSPHSALGPQSRTSTITIEEDMYTQPSSSFTQIEY